nr:hypothetical protein [Corynebacterium lactis]
MTTIDATALLDAADATLVDWANTLLNTLDISSFSHHVAPTTGA